MNPGYLAPRKGAGSYAKLTIYPLTIDEEEKDQALTDHKLFRRARVDIIRI